MVPGRFPIVIEKMPTKLEENKTIMLGAENPTLLSEQGGRHELLMGLQRGRDIRETYRFQQLNKVALAFPGFYASAIGRFVHSGTFPRQEVVMIRIQRVHLISVLR
jgi:hypothetical protein